MKYRTFGKTGLEISALGFGCMRLPVIGQDVTRIDEGEATRMVHHAVDRGINYFDTAYPYHSDSFKSGGTSEPFLAKALKNGYRQRVHVATKLPSWLVHSRQDMDLYLDEQLKRLETETIDFYLLHSLNRKSWDNLVHNDVFDFLEKAVASGKMRYAGFSFHDELELFREITDAFSWDFCQIMYNYFDWNFQAGREGLHHAAQKGLAVVVMEPLRGGALVNGLPDGARDILHRAVEGRSMADWAFRWLYRQPEVSMVLSGMTHFNQLEENLVLADRSSGIQWTAAEEEAIEKVNDLIHRLQRVNCTSCGYCMPCPNGVDIPRNFMMSNDHHMLNDRGARVRYFRLLGEAERASNCIQCGECLEKCPQNIPIPDELEYLAELFEG